MQSVAEEVAARTIGPLQEVEVPEQLGRMIDRHRETLIDLASALLSGGQSEAEVQDVLDRVFQSFKSDLSDAINMMKDHDRDH